VTHGHWSDKFKLRVRKLKVSVLIMHLSDVQRNSNELILQIET
jgi:hypothetical protein